MATSKITDGKNYDFFQKVTVSNADFSDTPDVIFNFKFQNSFTLLNEGTGIIEYSFNGTTLAGDMTPGKGSEGLVFDNRRVSKIWFRLKSGAASVVRVEAWASI